MNYLTEHALLDEYQSEFRNGHSMTTALLKVNEDIREAKDERKLTLLTLLDFSKAFDTVDTDLLLCKLRLLNLPESSVTWFESYLHERQQCVIACDYSSKWCIVKSEIQQGSVLGPLLFMIYINDVTNMIKHCRYHMYADDLQIYLHFHPDETNDSVNKINEDLNSISLWAHKFVLRLNPEKSQAIVMGHNHLRSTLDNSLHPTDHAACVANSGTSALAVSRELSTPWSTVRKVLRYIFHWYPYKIQAVQQLKPHDPQQCLDFALLFLERMERRNFKIVNVIESEVETTMNQFVAYSLALDESTDRNTEAHLAIFIRGVNEHFTVSECLLDVITKHNCRRSFPGTERHHRTEEVEFTMVVSIATDGAPASYMSK
ncbi:hypothetical protein ANN_19666 [Periplaneta americana]|uniref:Reverse transcriptase domain-containing protein n=1 Tax=Periplaneta americana TaxID=6978 RepID=A0ABQ8SAQ8_PERAM|nr:hypothetical protein ANN_19666 [Periplaneta americana]